MPRAGVVDRHGGDRRDNDIEQLLLPNDPSVGSARKYEKVIGFVVQGSAIRNGSMWKGAFRVSG
jgi:hypothetical protein